MKTWGMSGKCIESNSGYFEGESHDDRAKVTYLCLYVRGHSRTKVVIHPLLNHPKQILVLLPVTYYKAFCAKKKSITAKSVQSVTREQMDFVYKRNRFSLTHWNPKGPGLELQWLPQMMWIASGVNLVERETYFITELELFNRNWSCCSWPIA